MKKIVVFSNQGPVNDDLIVLLAALFPECDISIAEADTQDFEQFPGLAVIVYQYRNYGDVDRIKRAAADALVNPGLRSSEFNLSG
jgi:hypothetical protein